MADSLMQYSFSAGELSPTLYARADLAKYHVGAALMRNFFVDFRGGASTRPGTIFGGVGRDSTQAIRLIAFQFSTLQNYVLEFGHLYMRVFKDRAPVLETPINIAAATNGNPLVMTVIGHGYTTGDWGYVTGMLGMTELNGKTFKIVVLTVNTFTLLDMYDQPVNGSAYGVWTSGGTIGRVYTLTTPYSADDLATLKFTQSADVMTLVHPDYAPRNLSRTGHAAWSLDLITIGSTQVAPTGLVGTPSAAGTTHYSYVVTAVNAAGQESVASTAAAVANGVNIAVTAGRIALTWVAAAGAVGYNIYKATPSQGAAVPAGVGYGFIASVDGAGSTAYNDSNDVASFLSTPPLDTDPFAASNNPGTVAYFQQRRMYGGSLTSPETLWGSRTGQYNNFDVSNPVQDDDAITATLVSRQVNAIRHMIAMPGGLVVLTSGGAWQVSGGGATSALTPASITAVPQAYNGCNDVPPLVSNYDILYIQSRGSVVRDLSYDFFKNIYTGTDLTLLSNHFFTGYGINEWTWAEEPFKLVWAVRNDGALLSLTFLKEEEVQGWAMSSTQGFFESITSIQEGQEDVVYLVVSRFVNGVWLKYIETMASRQFIFGVEDAWAVDSGLTNSLTAPAATLRVSARTGQATFTATAPVFSAGDVGSVIRVGGGIAEIDSFTDALTVVGTFIRDIDIPAAGPLYPYASGEWTLTAPFTGVSGLEHLEGEMVKILGDGNVFPDQVVVGGTITLNQPVTRVIVGLGFTAKLQTLYLDVGEPTIQGKRKKINALTMRVAETRGLKAGPDFNSLTEFKMRNNQAMGTPIALATGDQRLVITPTWTVPGQMCIQQDYPLPATVLGVIPEITVGDTSQ